MKHKTDFSASGLLGGFMKDFNRESKTESHRVSEP